MKIVTIGLFLTIGFFLALTQCQAGNYFRSDEEVVTILYRQILERKPDAEGLEVYKRRLQDGSYTIRDIVRDMISSQEYISRFMVGPPLEVCRTLYHHILGRQASEKECSYPTVMTNIELASKLVWTDEFSWKLFYLVYGLGE